MYKHVTYEERYARVVYLKDGLSYWEIARKLGRSPNTWSRAALENGDSSERNGENYRWTIWAGRRIWKCQQTLFIAQGANNFFPRSEERNVFKKQFILYVHNKNLPFFTK